MNFIRAFIELGSYENKNKEYKPSLSILSGKTLLICDNTYKPYLKNNLYLLSLNPENDIDKLPDRNYLKKLPNYFPGTMLEIKIYLNNDHFLKKINENKNN